MDKADAYVAWLRSRQDFLERDRDRQIQQEHERQAGALLLSKRKEDGMSASAAATSNTKQPESAAHMLRKWFEQQVRMRPDEIDLKEFTAKATVELGQDPAFRAAILEEGIGLILPQIMHRHFQKERRQQQSPANLLPKDAAHQISERLTRWYEHVGGTVHKRLGAMNQEELRFAANAREKRVNTELRTIRFERTLADGLPNPKRTVEQHFKAEQLAEIWNMPQT